MILIFYSYICIMIKNLTGKDLIDFKNSFSIESYFAPTTVISTIDGQKYAIAIGSNWIPIPDEMTNQDVHEKWVRKNFNNEKSVIKKVKALRGKGEFTVTFGKKWECTCSTFKSRKKCGHIDIVKEELKNKLG